MAVVANQVPTLGQAANTFLTQGRNGKVLAAVNHATYLLTEAGELFWLATLESPKHRRSILLPAPLPTLVVGSTFTTGNRWISLETGTKLDFRTSEVWLDPVVPVEQVIELEFLPDKLFSRVENFLSQESPLGFGLFIRPVLQIARKEQGNLGSQPGEALTRFSWPVIERIARACFHHDAHKVLKEAEHLIGLGDGLTPSGDDFLGGLFFARSLLLCAFPNLLPLEFPNLHEWIDGNQLRTNLISFTLLKDNISGHALEPLNRLGIALLTNQPEEKVISAALELIKVGHSTGWSLLAGFVTGTLLAFQK
jgi:hypothetical protein